MFDPIILIVVNITSEILFNNLIESFYQSIRLEIKNYKKLAVHSEFYYKYYKES